MKTIKKTIILTDLLLFMGLFFVSSGQCDHAGGPFPVPQIYIRPVILLVGTFYPADARVKGDVIRIQIRDKNWIFQIKDALNMTGTELGSAIMTDLVPPVLRIVGPDELINPLVNSDVSGKLYSLMGTIYVSDNWMFMSAEKQGLLFDNDQEQKKH